MDLFDSAYFTSDKNVNPVHEAPPIDLMNELNIIIKQYGIEAPAALLEELTSLYLDPPPWKPW